MPHINRIRVNNVKYNFGTQAYEDFLLKPFGRNMLYDLANGGGKSVLMLLMLQTVLPNCSLDEKQPVEKLFRTGDGSQTIHSLIEWKLDEGDVFNGFRYMTTGFCARRAQNLEDAAKETAAIEYFNYCVFYRDYNENDIRNLPLVKGREKITFSGLKKYLRELERDNSLIVRVFDRKGEYQSFLADYGLYESEWEIIRGINKTEGHVRTYFESNYRTTRKVIEDLLIEGIIQKSFRLRGGQDTEDGMSKTLLDMKEKLLELSRKKNEIGNYDRQMELLALFAERADMLKESYARLRALSQEITQLYQAAGHFEAECLRQADTAEAEAAQTEQEIMRLHEKIDAARYLEDKTKAGRLEAEMRQLQKETAEEQSALEYAIHQLRLKEAMNDYLEYQMEKAKRDETAAELAAMKTEKSTLLNELQFLTWHMKKEISRRQKELAAELSALEKKYHALRIRRRSTDERERELSRELAELKSGLENARRRKEELAQALAEGKRQTGLLVFEECDHMLSNGAQEIERLKEQLARQKKEQPQIQQELEENARKQLECRMLGKQLSTEKELTKCFFDTYEEQRQVADRLLTVYGTRNYAKLQEQIRERQLQTRLQLLQISEKREGLETHLADLNSTDWGGFLEEQPGLSELADYIRARHGRGVQTGRQYLANQRPEQRELLLESYPYLSYSLIIEDGIQDLYEDAKLRNPKGGLLYPMIKEGALRNGRELVSTGDMQLFCRDFSPYFMEGMLEKEIGRVSAELSELEHRRKRLQDQLQTYEEDDRTVSFFLYCYEEKYQENRKQREEKEQAQRELQLELDELKQQQAELLHRQTMLEKNRQAVTDRMEELQRDQELLSQLKVKYARQEELEQLIASNSDKEKKLILEREQLLNQLTALDQEIDDTGNIRNSLTVRLERTDSLWKEKYQRYEVPGEYGECKLDGEALEAELNGKRQAYEREHSQADDKNRLLESYVNSMNRLLKNISQRGISLSSLVEKEERKELYATAEKELLLQRTENSRAEEALQKKKSTLEKITAEWNRLHGKTGQLAVELSERYGTTLELNMPEDEVEEFIEDNRSRIAAFTHQLDGIRRQKKELERETAVFAEMKKDIERMAKSGYLSLEASAAEPLLQKEAVVRERFAEAETEYDRARVELKKRQDDFSRHLLRVTDTLIQLDAASLAEEMRENIRLPEDETETVQMVKNLYEVRECLALEKNRIESGIEDIISLKSNFENQCLQRCVNIKTELDRLPKLSKITLDGELIPMISLQIPYVKEEQYQEKMSAYIDEIAANVDQWKEQSERLKYIRSALSFKKLFSVIVTDMNAIRLSLYKRERIKEQSRHLRYEEAVGSTGQSQGIYIQFLIAVINYITNINSGKGENDGLGKVIFIDNPFGAAKDVYIWEPIFELLRTNQVQLIVPARGTTPAITSRFDVNYILGQKLVDGKQQTVVVDYHSSVETGEMEYVPLQYEQESFDFLLEES